MSTKNRNIKKPLSSSKFLETINLDKAMITNEQALEIIKSGFLSVSKVAMKFYNVPEKASREFKANKRRTLSKRVRFNAAELERLHQIIKEELKSLGINRSFFD